MKKTFEPTLPEGYREALLIDAGELKFSILMNLAALALMIVILVIVLPMLRLPSFTVFFSFSKLLLPVLLLFAYIVGHELVHGIAYKLLTGQTLTYGFKLTVAFCGVPDIYVYRRTALVSLLAPFTVFTLLFGGLTMFLHDPGWRVVFAFMLAIHIGGCVGDLYDTLLYLFRFRSPDTLMNDTGPAQTFYVKE
ncbi:MAG: DUF3267 domain-containing protein [Oscillospiraceae bacterium]|nr:DUF3267 domain-containing protein [Oscillospiraceae bacterium]